MRFYFRCHRQKWCVPWYRFDFDVVSSECILTTDSSPEPLRVNFMWFEYFSWQTSSSLNDENPLCIFRLQRKPCRAKDAVSSLSYKEDRVARARVTLSEIGAMCCARNNVGRGWTETKTESLSNNQNWFMLEKDTENTGIPATTFRKKAGRIFFRFHFHLSLFE